MNANIRNGLVVAAAFVAMSAYAADAPPMPEVIRPARISGVGLNVVDIEKERAFYEQVLGLKVATRVPAQGPAREYLMSLSGDRTSGALVVLTKVDKASAGAGDFGRVILSVPNAAEIARRAVAAGYPQGEIRDGRTNMISDPEGHRIELYQAPAAR